MARESTIAKPGELVKALGGDHKERAREVAQSLVCPKCGSEETSRRSSGGRSWRVCLDCGNTFSGSGTVTKIEAKKSLVSKDFRDKKHIHSPKE